MIEEILNAIDKLNECEKFADITKLKEYVKNCLVKNDFDCLIKIPCEYLIHGKSIEEIHEKAFECGEKTALIHLVVAKRIPEFRKFIEEMLQVSIPENRFKLVP